MKIDGELGKDVTRAAQEAKRLEDAGYDGVFVGETGNDPFLQVLVAAQATERIELGTGVAIAFARTPMTVAATAYDLQRFAQGRFVLGLGSQVKAHIERRFSMPWSKPAARMREFVLALRAIWSTWQDGTPLKFEGDFYRHSLMTPFFSLPAHEWGPPPVWIAGVNERMTEAAGEVCDGFLCHAFTTADYVKDVTWPALRRGAEAAGRPLDGFEIAIPVFMAAGRDDAEIEAAIAGVKDQIAFYASTPAYRPVLDLHGWGELQPELTTMTKEGRWGEIGSRITDEMLHAFAAVGDPDAVAAEARKRFDGLVTRISLYMPYKADREVVDGITEGLRR